MDYTAHPVQADGSTPPEHKEESAMEIRVYYHVFYRNQDGEILEEKYNSLQEMDEQHEYEKECGCPPFEVVKVLEVCEFAEEVKTKWNA